MYELPYGNTQQLNLDWFIKRWQEFYAEWQETEAGIDGALDAEVERVENAMTNLYAARDAAAASATAAAASASSASNSATTATNAATAAAASATLANNKATAAGLSEAAAANSANSASNSAGAAATSASQANASAASATASATAAGNSATAAGNSATAAATSETNAAASAQRAEDAAASISGGGVVKSVENVPIASVDDALAENVVELVVSIEPVQAGTGDPAPDNVRAITGWTGANVSVTGVNIWDEEWEVGSFDFATGNPVAATDRIRSKNYCPCLPNTDYFLKIPNNNFRFLFYDQNKAFIQFLGFWDSSRVATTPDGAYYFKICGSVAYGTTYNYDLSVNYPATEIDYNAYDGKIYPVTFPTEAGTVYGGTLTNLGTDEWKLNVEWEYRDMGSLSWFMSNSGTATAYTSVLSPAVINLNEVITICSQYKSIRRELVNSSDNYFIWVDSNGRLRCKDSALENKTGEEFKTAMTGVQVVYKLANPVEYTLTGEAVEMLLGNNNVWADAGNVDLLRYYTDSKGYIDEQDALVKALIAKELDDMIADAALTANDFRIVNNTLYRITAPIASGATLTPNTNCIATTVSEILKTLLT